MIHFLKQNLTAEDAFWVMVYFLNEQYQVAEGQFDLSDVLSACQPFEFDENGHFDGQFLGNRRVASADSGIVHYWNAAIQKLQEEGRAKPSSLTQ